jgi:hypothetical protein
MGTDIVQRIAQIDAFIKRIDALEASLKQGGGLVKKNDSSDIRVVMSHMEVIKGHQGEDRRSMETMRDRLNSLEKSYMDQHTWNNDLQASHSSPRDYPLPSTEESTQMPQSSDPRSTVPVPRSPEPVSIRTNKG